METISRRRFLPLPLSESAPPGLGLRTGLCAFLSRCADLVLGWQARASQRAALASLDDRMLKDVGLSRAAASEEARRPFWRP
jgi:uncharacterized protein YjiS (DUF1127 family)